MVNAIPEKVKIEAQVHGKTYDAILEAKSICGMEKLMWGSDYPRTMTAITYLMSKDFVEKSDALTEEEKRKFLEVKWNSGNAPLRYESTVKAFF